MTCPCVPPRDKSDGGISLDGDATPNWNNLLKMGRISIYMYLHVPGTSINQQFLGIFPNKLVCFNIQSVIFYKNWIVVLGSMCFKNELKQSRHSCHWRSTWPIQEVALQKWQPGNLQGVWLESPLRSKSQVEKLIDLFGKGSFPLKRKVDLPTHVFCITLHSFLVGGWTNPFWKICERQIGSWKPQLLGWFFSKIFELPPPSFPSEDSLLSDFPTQKTARFQIGSARLRWVPYRAASVGCFFFNLAMANTYGSNTQKPPQNKVGPGSHVISVSCYNSIF